MIKKERRNNKMETFEVIINIVEATIIICFLTQYCGFKYNGWIKAVSIPCGIAMAAGAMTLLNIYYVNEGIFCFGLVLTYFLYTQFF